MSIPKRLTAPGDECAAVSIMDRAVLLLIYLLTAASSIILAEEDEDGSGKNSGCCRPRNIVLGEGKNGGLVDTDRGPVEYTLQ